MSASFRQWNMFMFRIRNRENVNEAKNGGCLFRTLYM